MANKVIKCLKAKDGSLYIVGNEREAGLSADYVLTCMAITHKRDGETGMFKAEKDEARYEIVYADPNEQYPMEVHVIPQREMTKLVFVVEEKVKKEKKEPEADVVMDKS